MDNEYQDLDRNDLTKDEKIIILVRTLELYKLMMMCVVVRNGGEVVIKNDELNYTRKNYQMAENLNIEDFTCDMRFRVRLK